MGTLLGIAFLLAILGPLLTILQVIWIDGVLSIDNVAALAVLAEPLPNDRTPPWPLNHRFFGSQQQCALKVGMWMAFIFRGVLLACGVWLLTGPFHIWANVIGGAWLGWLVVRHFFWPGATKQRSIDAHHFWRAVFWIEVTDLTFSWDNISAIITLSSNVWWLIIGTLISIPLLRFAAGKLIPIMERIPVLEHAAYVIIGIIALELELKSLLSFQPNELLQFGVSLAVILVALAYHYLIASRVNFRKVPTT